MVSIRPSDPLLSNHWANSLQIKFIGTVSASSCLQVYLIVGLEDSLLYHLLHTNTSHDVVWQSQAPVLLVGPANCTYGSSHEGGAVLLPGFATIFMFIFDRCHCSWVAETPNQSSWLGLQIAHMGQVTKVGLSCYLVLLSFSCSYLTGVTAAELQRHLTSPPGWACKLHIWVKSRRWGCLVTWFCYHFHVHIWQVSLQLSCRDTWQIWTWKW